MGEHDRNEDFRRQLKQHWLDDARNVDGNVPLDAGQIWRQLDAKISRRQIWRRSVWATAAAAAFAILLWPYPGLRLDSAMPGDKGRQNLGISLTGGTIKFEATERQSVLPASRTSSCDEMRQSCDPFANSVRGRRTRS